MRKQKRAPNRIYPVGFVMDREEFMFRCFMTGAAKIHKRLSDKRVKLNIHNMYDWRKGKDYTGRGMLWFSIKMGRDYDMFWQDWEAECKKLKMRYTIRDNGSYRNKVHTIRLEW